MMARLSSIKRAQKKITTTPTHELNSRKFIKRVDKYILLSILNVPVSIHKEPYVAQEIDYGNIIEIKHKNILDTDPTADASASKTKLPFPLYLWLKNDSKVTLFMSSKMSSSKQVHMCLRNNEGSFLVERKGEKNIINLPDFEQHVKSMIHNKILFQEFCKKSTIVTAHHLRAASNVVCNLIKARKVSGDNLISLDPSTLLQYISLQPSEKKTWDNSYREEYRGLEMLATWEMISEEE